jgi:hypothetical protein
MATQITTTRSLMDALSYDPFAGDMGSPGDRIIEDKIVICRKSRKCENCKEAMKVGSILRTLLAKFNGKMSRYTWCEACCRAMISDVRNDTNKFDKRFREEPVAAMTPITTTRLSAEEEEAIRNFTTNEDGLSRRGWMPHEKGGWDRIGNRISAASAIEWQLEWDVESLLAELTALRSEVEAEKSRSGQLEMQRNTARREYENLQKTMSEGAELVIDGRLEAARWPEETMRSPFAPSRNQKQEELIIQWRK